MCFEKVATTTKGLSIRSDVYSTIKNGNNMIEFKKFSRAAVSTDRVLPFSSLKRTELDSMSSFCWKFMPDVILTSWKRTKHFISMQFPKFFGSDRYSFKCFLSVVVAGSILVPNAFSFPGHRDQSSGLFRMFAVPPRRIFTAEIDAFTFERAGFTAFLTCNLSRTSVNRTLANQAVERRHISSYGTKENWVNSGKHLTSYESVVSKSILSEALAETPLNVQRLGVEPYVGDKAPTKTRRESDDIVRTAW